MKLKIVFILMLCLFFHSSIKSQSSFELINSIKSSFDTIQKYASPFDTVSFKHDIKTSLRVISHLITCASSRSFQINDFRESISDLSSIIHSYSTKIKNKTTQFVIEEELSQILSRIQEDIALKLKNYDCSVIKPSLNFVNNTKVELKFITLINDSIVNGYRVKLNYYWEYKAKKAKFICKRLTSNSEIILEKGIYIAWVEKNGKKIKNSELRIDVGNKNSSMEIIEFDL